jgi:hypothetical protein
MHLHQVAFLVLVATSAVALSFQKGTQEQTEVSISPNLQSISFASGPPNTHALYRREDTSESPDPPPTDADSYLEKHAKTVKYLNADLKHHAREIPQLYEPDTEGLGHPYYRSAVTPVRARYLETIATLEAHRKLLLPIHQKMVLKHRDLQVNEWPFEKLPLPWETPL